MLVFFAYHEYGGLQVREFVVVVIVYVLRSLLVISHYSMKESLSRIKISSIKLETCKSKYKHDDCVNKCADAKRCLSTASGCECFECLFPSLTCLNTKQHATTTEEKTMAVQSTLHSERP